LEQATLVPLEKVKAPPTRLVEEEVEAPTLLVEEEVE
jgi:hypothetical protein